MENMAPGYRKLERDQSEDINRVIPELDIYEYNPWDLPQVSGEASLRDTEQWFFFIPRQESEARGGRPRRLTTTGYWKATGSPNHVYSSENLIIGMKRTMVFYNGRAPNGHKTEWKMNEYKAIVSAEPSSTHPPHPRTRVEYSVCRVYKKSKGDHHGGGGGQASQSGEAMGQMELDDEPLLDWEQVDWFLAKHDSTE
ncbi:hypothetical protein K1719_028430 [Acacia pycnantha]|nr:hypothetical protein K1719_028430 [Acacia pycnantha]